jgi:hypothetical protein
MPFPASGSRATQVQLREEDAKLPLLLISATMPVQSNQRQASLRSQSGAAICVRRHELPSRAIEPLKPLQSPALRDHVDREDLDGLRFCWPWTLVAASWIAIVSL